MGKIYVGCKEAREISLCALDPENGKYGGANPGAHVLMTKNRKAPGAEPQTPSETDDMDAAEIAKAAKTQAAAFVTKTLSWNDVTKAHYLALPAADQEAFMEKAAAEQASIAETAKAAVDAKAKEDEAAKAGKSASELATSEALKSANAQIEELKKARKVDAIEKRARDDFSGFPGGVEEAVKQLTLASEMSEEGRVAFEGMMKAQIANAQKFSSVHSERTAEETAKAMPAAHEFAEAAKARAKEKSISITKARGELMRDKSFSELVSKMQTEAREVERATEAAAAA